ncbi:MAG: aldehyde ferredoxin oxidoreductase family protein [Chloroflexi bacterium]|nr:aldehyde ferredoxin oxidoreductase family protein [Chloroflexota bacterium]
MAAIYGWAGTFLDIDLTTGKIERIPVSPEFAEKFIGGMGFNAARLFERVKPGVDALSPENVILFGIGPLTGTLYPGNTRLTVTAKSPLTDVFGATNIGGFIGGELRYAGYDQLAVTGKAARPVYIWIDDERVTIRDATHLWGTTTWETGQKIREELGDPDIQVICIGQAGENLVRFANVTNPPRGSGGRAGMGAVMGSKNLKAVAIRGTKSVKVARLGEFVQLCRESTIFGRSEPRYKHLRTTGSPKWIDFIGEASASGGRNFTRQISDRWEEIKGEKFLPGGEYTVRKRGCFSCPIGCSGFFNVKSGEFAQIFGRTPEAGVTIMGLGCDIYNVPFLLKMQELLDKYGMDSLSGGQMLAWAMDCYDRGILTKEDTGGLALEWGNYAAVTELVPMIAKREGFGSLLADGEKRAPQNLGRGSEKLIYHIKGMSCPAEDPRVSRTFGFSYYTAPRGADHLTANITWVPDLLRGSELGKKMAAKYKKWGSIKSAEHDDDIAGMGESQKWMEDATAIINAAEVCTRTGGSFEFMAKALSAATGLEFTLDKLLAAGERIFNMEKAFNAREGLTRKDDNFSNPEKFTREPVAEGPCKGDVLFNLEEFLDEYYQARGWDVPTGLQTRAKLIQLGLADIIPELESAGAVR